MDESELLEQLRAVFRDELTDHLATLEREVVTLARPAASTEEQDRALLEVHRAAHSLKGAARAVGNPEIERLCHDLETRLAGVRQGTGVDPSEARAATDRTIAALRAWAEAHLPPPPAPEPPTPASGVTATDSRTAGSPPPRRADAGFDTVRVPLRAVAGISVVGEELLATASRGERLGIQLGPLDDAIAELGRALGAAARRGRDPGLQKAQRTLQTLSVWALDHRRHQATLWADVRRRATTLSQASRTLRAVRFDTLAPVLERTALETAADLGKRVDFEVHGGDAEIDRRVVEGLRDPLVQVLRNAIDHGLEPPADRRRSGKAEVGRVTVTVRQAGTEVVVTIADDGRGLDEAALRQAAERLGLHPEEEGRPLRDIIFEAGFTTRAQATATSGRGIGLDVTRQRIAELQGRVSVEPGRDHGTCFRIVVPGDLSVTRGLLIDVQGQRYCLLETAVTRCVLIGPANERLVEGRRYLAAGSELIPLCSLASLLGVPVAERARGGRRPAVVLASGQRTAAFEVDGFAGNQDLVVKPLGERVRRGGFVIGATLLGEGHLSCVLDAAALVHYGRAQARGDLDRDERRGRYSILVVDDSVTTRQLLASILASAGYQVETAVDGEDAWRRIAFADPPEIVVSDIEMPRVDGFQLLSRIRSSPLTARLPVILVTALASDDDRRRALELGADAYIIKGRFDQHALLEAVEELAP